MGNRPWGTRKLLALLAAAALALALAACSKSSSQSSKATLVVADLAPFTGPDAILGPGYLAGCYAAVRVINGAGGVAGHQLTCKQVDTRGDPADAVPATRQMFASTSNLALVIGVTSDEASAVVPIINNARMVVFSVNGESEFDTSSFQYFYRLTPADIQEAFAMVAIAHSHYHYQRIALAFGNDVGSQTFVKPAISAINKAGMTLTDNETLNLTASSFRTEAEKIVSSHPDGVLTEALGSADAIFMSEVKQLNGGKMIPFIGTNATVDPSWFKAVSKAIGVPDVTSTFAADALAANFSGPAYDAFKAALLGSSSQMSTVAQYTTHPQSLHMYDAVTLAALAMAQAKSTSPSVYHQDIKAIANGVPGAVVVDSFAQGVQALNKGEKIRYIGPGGPTNLDQYNNSQVAFEIDQYTKTGGTTVVGAVPASDISALSSG